MKVIDEIRGNYRKYLLMLLDILSFCIINLLFYVLSPADILGISAKNVVFYLLSSAFLLAAILTARILLGVYRTVWRYTSTRSYFNLLLADILGGMAVFVVTAVIFAGDGLWHIVTVTALAAHVSMMGRLGYRLWYKQQNNLRIDPSRKNAAIVGAGHLGTYLVNDLQTNANSRFNPVFFIDNDRNKIGNTVAGLKVYSQKEAQKYIQEFGITDVIIAISDSNSERISPIYHFYRDLGCTVKIFDSLVHERSDNDNGKRSVRDFQIEDLLFRKPRKINDQGVLDFYRGKTIMVTGGGGSIGSEICRQIARCAPRKLIILDCYENNAYEIQQELQRAYGSKLDLSVEIASVRDARHLDRIFEIYRPEVVFHAAAHKHVPLMEHSGYEAVKNNVFGCHAAEKYGAEKFILISTDKAVNPTNAMGATKRICEMVIQCRKDSQTSFAAVRFGNVLGSNGSVIPLFQQQIAAGGPVTVTDKRIIRYFMTIREAS